MTTETTTTETAETAETAPSLAISAENTSQNLIDTLIMLYASICQIMRPHREHLTSLCSLTTLCAMSPNPTYRKSEKATRRTSYDPLKLALNLRNISDTAFLMSDSCDHLTQSMIDTLQAAYAQDIATLAKKAEKAASKAPAQPATPTDRENALQAKIDALEAKLNASTAVSYTHLTLPTIYSV